MGTVCSVMPSLPLPTGHARRRGQGPPRERFDGGGSEAVVTAAVVEQAIARTGQQYTAAYRTPALRTTRVLATRSFPGRL